MNPEDLKWSEGQECTRCGKPIAEGRGGPLVLLLTQLEKEYGSNLDRAGWEPSDWFHLHPCHFYAEADIRAASGGVTEGELLRRIARQLEGAQNLDPDVASARFEQAVEGVYGAASDRELAGLTMEFAGMARQQSVGKGRADRQSHQGAERPYVRTDGRPLWEIKGIGDARCRELKRFGVSTTLQLLGADVDALQEIASEASNISQSQLERWREDALAYHAGQPDTSISPTKAQEKSRSSESSPGAVGIFGFLCLFVGLSLFFVAIFGGLWETDVIVAGFVFLFLGILIFGSSVEAEE